jgi:hypothetical protein
MKPQHKKILGIIGDNNFPKCIHGTVQDRIVALRKVSIAIAELKPSLVYIMPTRGVATEILPILQAMGIPFIIVAPYPDFSVPLSTPERGMLKEGCDKAKNIVLLDSKNPIDGGDTTLLDGAEFVMDSCNGLLFAHSEMMETSEDCFELVELVSVKHPESSFFVSYDGEDD